jgi:glutamine synthetase
MVKSIAEKHSLRATFMPKPFTNLTGNGCHCHISIWDKAGKKNMFLDKKDELGLSKTGYNFLGGIMESADKMAAVFNPTVNSYKRINGSITTSGATWSPSSITWAGNNRTHMVRVPGAGRFELRLMDGATNPYLLQAGILLLGLDGFNNKRDPGKRLDINMYTEGHKAGKVKKLPLNLLDAIRDFDKSKIIRAGFGDDLVNSYVKLKNQDWGTFNKHLSSWERETTLDC